MPSPRLTSPFRAVRGSLNPEIRSRLDEIGENEPNELGALLERARESCRAQNWMRSEVALYRDHAIDPVIGDSRPYERYDLDNLSPVENEYADLHESGQRLQMTRAGMEWERRDAEGRLIRGHGGHLIKRHVPPGLPAELPRIPAEMRPDGDVLVSQRRWSYRPLELPANPKDIPRYPNGRAKGKRVPKSRWFPRSEAAEEWMTEKERERALERWDSWSDRVHIWEGHGDLYKFQRRSHYLFPPTPKVWILDSEHDHADEEFASNPRGLKKHIRDDHRCHNSRAHREGRPHRCAPKDVEGRHAHWRRVPDRTKNYAKRIDMHPLAALLAADAEIVFFCIEGCIKADAILTEILRTGLKATVVSVPSVTLWGPGESWYDELPELQLVADRYFRGRHAVIVCDRDWHENPLVHDQALFCRTTLRRMLDYKAALVKALMTRSPFLCSIEIAAPTEGKGADDHIRELLQRGENETSALTSFLVERREGAYISDLTQGWNRQGIKRHAEDLHYISLHTVRESKTLRVSVRALERVTGVYHDRIRRSLVNLKKAGHIKTDKILKTERNVWRDSFFDRSEQFTGPPTVREITLSDRAYTESEFIPLSKFLIGYWQAPGSATHRSNDMALATVSADDLAGIRLQQSMQGEKLDHILAVLLAFQDGETSADEWSRYLASNEDGQR
jgi:hypothetical protein